MKKILIGYLIDGKKSGIDKYLLNVINIIRKYDVTIDCLTSMFDLELKNMLADFGVGLITIPSLKHPIKQYKTMISILESGQYDEAYFNISEAFNSIGVLAAFKMNVNRIVVHSHSSGVNSNNIFKRTIRTWIHELSKPTLVDKASVLCACSDTASEWMYSRKDDVTIINNAIDLNKFKFDEDVRNSIRKEFDLEEKIVVGHVGAFCYQKHSEFLVDIAVELKKINPQYVIMSVGDGAELDKVKRKADKLKVSNNMIFLGVRNDVHKLLSAMDVFVLPSRFEGLPIVAVEAQASGLPIVLSDTISKSSKMLSNCSFLNINEPADVWAKQIDQFSRMGRENLNKEMLQKYDISVQKKQILNVLQVK
nr:glycosyltransferase [uncultured Agathobacter sp.]